MAVSPKLIGVAGAAGSGKDTVAVHLSRFGYTTVSFALPLKRALSAMFGVDFVNMDRRDKERPMESLGVTPRRLMQTLGTEWGRELIDPDIWVKALDLHIRQSDREFFVVSDVRFPNEVQWVRSKEGLLIFLRRRSTVSVGSHASEIGVGPHDADVVLQNDGTIAQLQQAVESALRGKNANTAA